MQGGNLMFFLVRVFFLTSVRGAMQILPGCSVMAARQLQPHVVSAGKPVSRVPDP